MIAKFTINDDEFILMPLHDAINNEDIESNYKNWFNDSLVTKYNSHGLFPFNPLDDIKDFLKDKSRIVWAICHKDNDGGWYYIHIGNISLQSINLINRSAEIACVIGETEYWRKGITTQALKYLIHHGFNKLGLNRIWSGTASVNIGMQKVFTKLGFNIEGVMRQGMFLNGEFVDIIQFGLLNDKIFFKKFIDKITPNMQEGLDEILEDKKIEKFEIGKIDENETLPGFSEALYGKIEGTNILKKETDKEISSLCNDFDNSVIDNIEKIRTKNNSNWMDIVKIALKHDPENTKQVLSQIMNSDKSIVSEVEKLVKE